MKTRQHHRTRSHDTRRQRHTSSRNESVLEVATQLLAVNPRASMQVIAAAAGVSRTTLHRLYPSRDALIEAIGLDAADQITAAFAAARLDEGPAIAALQRLIEAVVPLVNQFAFLISETQIQESAGMVERDRALQQQAEAFFRRGQATGAFRFDLPAAWLAYALSGLLLGAAEGVRQGDIAPRETARLILETLLNGVASPPRETGSPPFPASERTSRD
jgi:AcrR family transcriptional regulator